jgi:hypothetical protein
MYQFPFYYTYLYTKFAKKAIAFCSILIIKVADKRVLSYFIDGMKLKQIIISIALLMGAGPLFVSPIVSAQTQCGGTETSIIGCEQRDTGGVENSGVWGLLLFVLNILTMGVAVAAVGGIVYGAVLYTSSGGSPEQTKKAKQIIFDTVIGIGAFALMYAALNYLIPGGLFK